MKYQSKNKTFNFVDSLINPEHVVICIRCGLTKKDIEKDGAKCKVYGKSYNKHKYC